MKLVTVASFDNSFSAHLAQFNLSENGIGCYIKDENSVSLNPMYNIAYGGIKLQVNEPDVEMAIGILQRTEQNFIENDDDEYIVCPKCNSKEIYDNFKTYTSLLQKVTAIISSLVLGYPFGFKKTYLCKKCNHAFS